ncbi:MAG: hypothetical protein ABH871_09845 [Pseudomonadota bacterium]
MRGIAFIIAACMLATAISAGCVLKRQPFKGVVGYHDGKVYLTPDRYYEKGKYYRVGILPGGWKRMATPAYTISFYSEDYKSSISTDAYCGRSVRDRTLASLTGDIITALEDRKFSDEKEFMLDGRGAIRQQVEGKVDGVPTLVDLVTLRKNACVFDFYLVSPKEASLDATEDFEGFFNAFHY